MYSYQIWRRKSDTRQRFLPFLSIHIFYNRFVVVTTLRIRFWHMMRRLALHSSSSTATWIFISRSFSRMWFLIAQVSVRCDVTTFSTTRLRPLRTFPRRIITQSCWQITQSWPVCSIWLPSSSRMKFREEISQICPQKIKSRMFSIGRLWLWMFSMKSWFTLKSKRKPKLRFSLLILFQ